MKLLLLCMILVFPIAGVENLYAQGKDATAGGTFISSATAQEQQIASLEVQQQHLYLYFGIIITLLTAVVLYLLYHNRSLKKKSSRAISEERQNTEQQRQKAARQIEQFEQKFLTSVSHEIRTPMNTVLGMTNLTLDTELTEKQKQYLTAVKKSSENLLVVINDVLGRGKMEVQKLELENIQFNLRDVVSDTVDSIKSSAYEKGLKLETHVAADVPGIVTGDPYRLNQVLMNLCGNAIRFSDKGIVRVVIERLPGTEATLQFRVIDSASEAPEDKVGDLFDSFLHAEPGTWHRYDEKDLRLSIAKKLVELQGGEIEVKSEKGAGSEFFFTIAYRVPDERAAASLAGIKILVAEDNEYNQVVITDTLEALIPGVRVDIAENGGIAIQKHLNGDYDVILMDVQMPEMDGLDATRLIREQAEGEKKKIPIIALTAGVLNADLEECYNAGMNDYVPKPFTREHLLKTLAKYYGPGKGMDTKSAGNGTAVTDLTFLKDFCKGDKAAMKKYIDIYLKVTPGNLQKISSALHSGEYIAMAKTVHAMKAHLNYMGMKETRKTAEIIETHGREQNNLSELPQLINKLQNDCERSMIELQLFS